METPDRRNWHTSSYSAASGSCVEVADDAPNVLVRDTRHRDHGHLDFTPAAWTTFLHALKAGHL
jgi:hypothetical protein